MVKFEFGRSRIVIRYGNSKFEWTIEPRYWRNPLLAVLILLAIPILIHQQPGMLTLFTIANIYAMIAIPLSWQIIGTGRINFGPQFFVGLGGYTAGLLSIHYGLTPLQTLLIVILVCLVFGLVLSLLTLIAGGLYFSLITLILPLIFLEITFIYGDIFRGESGIGGIAPLISLGSIKLNYLVCCYISLAIALTYMLIVDKIFRSRWGLKMAAINDNEDVARMLGVDVNKYKIVTFTVTSIFIGIAGWFIAHYFTTFSGVTYLPINYLIKLLLAVIIGGRGSIYGALAGAYFITFVEEMVKVFGPIHYVIFPTLLLGLIFILPEGLWGIYRKHKYREYYPSIRIRRR